jgi:hypothetical protein
MILTCPSCGAAASLEAWANDRDWRELIALIPTIPATLQTRAISYLGLFRTGKRALKPGKALKILTGLRDLVVSGSVHWDGGETRPAPAGLWEQALDAVIERRPNALTNHNYLVHTAWEMAAGLAAESERVHAKTRSREAERAALPYTEARDNILSSPPKRRGCFCCESFRPPKGCEAKSRPVSGNQMLGCKLWQGKPAPVAALMGGLAAGLKEMIDGEKANEEGLEGGL